MTSNAFVTAFLFIVVILAIIFGGRNPAQVETNKANMILIRRHYGPDYWAYMFLTNFANVALIFYFYDVYGNIVFFAWPIVLILIMPIHNWFYSRLLKKSKLKEQALTK
tara:strand:+ start:272 stop:598 length:327 start_codon:yes stop_codon:yes gene_type:complete